LRLRSLARQPVQHRGVLHEDLLPRTARHADHVHLRTGFKVVAGQEMQGCIRANRLECLPDEVEFGVAHRRQELRRRRDIQLCHVRVQQKSNSEGLAHLVLQRTGKRGWMPRKRMPGPLVCRNAPSMVSAAHPCGGGFIPR